MNQKFGIAVVGLDHWYTAFGVCDIAKQSSVVRLAAIGDHRPGRGEWAAREHPEAAFHESEGDAIRRDDVDLVAICAPTAEAPALAIAALEAGKHVVAVKPSAPDLGVFEAIVAASRSADRFFGSFEGMQRLHPKAQLLRQLISSGAIGTVLSCHQVGHGGLPSPWPGMPSGAPSWWLDPSSISTGAWLDHAIYAIDLIRYAVGGEIDHVSGLIGNRLHLELPLEDYGIGLMRLAGPTGPVSVVIEDTWAAEAGGGAHWFRVLGTNGWLHAEGSDWVVVRDGESVRHPISDAPFFPLDPLASALQSGTTLPFGADDARANLAACLQFYARAARDPR